MTLHPLWDVVLRRFGAGHEFAPHSWVIARVSFDRIVAAYVVAAHRLDLAGGRARRRSRITDGNGSARRTMTVG